MRGPAALGTARTRRRAFFSRFHFVGDIIDTKTFPSGDMLESEALRHYSFSLMPIRPQIFVVLAKNSMPAAVPDSRSGMGLLTRSERQDRARVSWASRRSPMLLGRFPRLL